MRDIRLSPERREELTELNASKPVKVIAVTGGKGGVGKTTVSANLAVSIAARGRDVMLLDADLGLANVDVVLGLHTRFHLGHVLNGECALEDAIVTGPHGLQIVPAASGGDHPRVQRFVSPSRCDGGRYGGRTARQRHDLQPGGTPRAGGGL
jgi:Mrp family chromosome partitioning ATPase